MNKYRKILYVLFFVIFIGFNSGCSKLREQKVIETVSPTVSQAPSSDFSDPLANNALLIIENFEKNHPNRSAGTPEELNAGNYIIQELEHMGYSVNVLPFTYETSWADHLKSQNIEVRLAKKTNSKTDSKNYIVLGAHYDSVPSGKGSDDNASGVSVLLTLAKYLKTHPIESDLVFVFFGAEEVGLKGSEAYALNLIKNNAPLPSLMVNFDSLIAGDYTYVYGSESQPETLKELLTHSESTSLGLITQDVSDSKLPYGETIDASDHAAFKNLGIPYLYFEATNWNIGNHDGYTQTADPQVVDGEIWHTPNDTLSYMEQIFPGRAKHHLTVFIKSILFFLESYKA